MNKFIAITARLGLVALLGALSYTYGYTKALQKGYDIGYAEGIYDVFTNLAKATATLKEIQKRQGQ